jgi:hypothetical protein
MATDACPNCGKPTLATDAICWHCGYTLPRRARPRPETKAPRRGASRRSAASLTVEDESIEYDFRALAVYGLLTLAIILGLWLVMRALSRQPLLVRSAALDLGGNWVAVTDADLRYTLSIPTEWQWLDLAFRDQEELLGRVTGRQPYIGRALRVWEGADEEAAILAVAVGARTLEQPDPAPLVVVGRSEPLRDLTPDQALALAAQRLAISDEGINTRTAGQPQARFATLDNAGGYECRHLFTADAQVAYLVAACAPQANIGPLRGELDDILDSFQLLEH